MLGMMRSLDTTAAPIFSASTGRRLHPYELCLTQTNLSCFDNLQLNLRLCTKFLIVLP